MLNENEMIHPDKAGFSLLNSDQNITKESIEKTYKNADAYVTVYIDGKKVLQKNFKKNIVNATKEKKKDDCEKSINKVEENKIDLDKKNINKEVKQVENKKEFLIEESVNMLIENFKRLKYTNQDIKDIISYMENDIVFKMMNKENVHKEMETIIDEMKNQVEKNNRKAKVFKVINNKVKRATSKVVKVCKFIKPFQKDKSRKEYIINNYFEGKDSKEITEIIKNIDQNSKEYNFFKSLGIKKEYIDKWNEKRISIELEENKNKDNFLEKSIEDKNEKNVDIVLEAILKHNKMSKENLDVGLKSFFEENLDTIKDYAKKNFNKEQYKILEEKVNIEIGKNNVKENDNIIDEEYNWMNSKLKNGVDTFHELFDKVYEGKYNDKDMLIIFNKSYMEIEKEEEVLNSFDNIEKQLNIVVEKYNKKMIRLNGRREKIIDIKCNCNMVKKKVKSVKKFYNSKIEKNNIVKDNKLENVFEGKNIEEIGVIIDYVKQGEIDYDEVFGDVGVRFSYMKKWYNRNKNKDNEMRNSSLEERIKVSKSKVKQERQEIFDNSSNKIKKTEDKLVNDFVEKYNQIEEIIKDKESNEIIDRAKNIKDNLLDIIKEECSEKQVHKFNQYINEKQAEKNKEVVDKEQKVDEVIENNENIGQEVNKVVKNNEVQEKQVENKDEEMNEVIENNENIREEVKMLEECDNQEILFKLGLNNSNEFSESDKENVIDLNEEDYISLEQE